MICIMPPANNTELPWSTDANFECDKILPMNRLKNDFVYLQTTYPDACALFMRSVEIWYLSIGKNIESIYGSLNFYQVLFLYVNCEVVKRNSILYHWLHNTRKFKTIVQIWRYSVRWWW